MKRILLITLLSVIILSGCSKETKKEESKLVENNGMLSYTIDGEKTDIKPNKEDGYIVNKIECSNGSDMMWDNDNWEVELTKINNKDRCKVDFTKDASTPGYRVTVTSNMPSSLDSLSKSTTLNGTIIIYSTSKIESVTGCNGIIEDNKVIISNITQNQTCNMTIEDKTLAGIIKQAYPPKDGRTDFSVIDEGTPALYTGEDDQGDTYYFSGNGSSMNNWVSFAGKMWRIIRINGNGSIRLLYAGSGSTDGYIESITYSIDSNHPTYVGWKYTKTGNLAGDRGNTNKSTIYSKVETWYNGLGSTNQNYIDVGAIYCNDRSIGSGTYSASSTCYYGAYTRLKINKTPTFSCSSTSDRFSGKNGDIPVGLMTADEIAFAGGADRTNSPKAYYYLNVSGGSSTGSKWWWTMSPYYFLSDNSINNGARVFYVSGSGNVLGYLNGTNVADSGVIRPVISLKPEVLVTGGDGSGKNPYTVKMPD